MLLCLPLSVRGGALQLFHNFPDQEEYLRMKEKDFEPAKIVSKPEAKPTDKDMPPASTKTPEAELVANKAAAQAGPKAQQESNEDSWKGIIDRFTGKSKSTVVWASPYDMHTNGVFKDLYKANVDRIAQDLKGIIIVTVFHAYLLIGYYLLAAFFNGDESLAFSRNPYKETSINDLAKRDDIPFTRQKLTDCIKAAAVDMELRRRGHHFEFLHYEHLLQIARLKKQEQRLEKAQEANDKKLTSNEFKKVIDDMLGKTPSQDKQIGRTLIRHLREFVRLAGDDDVQAFLEDKERSAALDNQEIAQLLDFSGKFREIMPDSEEMLKQLEANLRENFLKKQPQKTQEATVVQQK